MLREDYAALVGPNYTSADVGAHSPAYVMAFHLCLLLVGWGILGVRWNRIGTCAFSVDSNANTHTHIYI